MEGQGVIYVGLAAEGLQPGDKGRCLLRDNRAAHVLWSTGGLAGQESLVYADDLSAEAQQRAASLVEDSLEFASLQTFSVRDVYETQGEAGVINAMAQLGHLAAFSDIAEEAIALVAARIRQDPSFREVTATLDEEEGESVIRLASACLIRDAFAETE
jgi:uncharacterized protein YoaH (UPF0181 family)